MTSRPDFRVRLSELLDTGAGAILVFLCGPAANAAGTDQHTLAEDRHGALAIEHVVAFGRGDAVILRGPDGHEVGRGLIAYDADDADKIKGRSSADVLSILGFEGRTEMIHRDDLVMAGH